MPLLNFCTQLVVGCCGCSSSDGLEGREEEKRMELSPRFSLWRKKAGTITGASTAGKTSVGPEALSPSRLPSTKLQAGRPLRAFPAMVAKLATTDQVHVGSERRDLAFITGVKVIPHPDKVQKGGEDAYFISKHSGGVLGVADGVSGWAAENVDPALFSKELMARALAAVEADEVQDDPRKLMERAHFSTCSIGAATAIIAILDKKGILRVANLGDCGLRIIRRGRLVYATTPQQHYFDCPYQLSSENAQTAADATVYELGVLEGDTVVMGSDGLFDNVFDYDIESTVQVFNDSEEGFASNLAVALATLASKHSLDRTYDSPYAKEAVMQGHDLPWWRKIARQKIGGKIDDITVVVGHIVGTPTVSTKVEPSAQENSEHAESVAPENASADTQSIQDQPLPVVEQDKGVRPPGVGEPVADNAIATREEEDTVEGMVDVGNAPVSSTGQEKVDSPSALPAKESGAPQANESSALQVQESGAPQANESALQAQESGAPQASESSALQAQESVGSSTVRVKENAILDAESTI